MNIRTAVLSLAAVCAFGLQPAAAEEQPLSVNIKRLSLDTALKLAEAALEQCRKEGVQVAVTVVDRGGHPQVVLRDVLAMDVTLDISQRKAYTAMSMNMPTSELEDRLNAGNALGVYDRLFLLAGGLPITAGGTIYGGVGVSGSPSAKTDAKCARAGLDAISADLEMQGL